VDRGGVGGVFHSPGRAKKGGGTHTNWVKGVLNAKANRSRLGGKKQRARLIFWSRKKKKVNHQSNSKTKKSFDPTTGFWKKKRVFVRSS